MGISCLLSHEKILCPKRKSHVFSVLAPPTMRKSPVSCLMRKSHVSRENLMCQENISYLIIFGPPPTRKSPVSCLMRKSHDPRENLMSFQYRVPPNEKISYLLSHEKISCPKRKYHVFSVLAPPMRKSFVSCLMRKFHISRENLMSYKFWVPPNENISCLLSHGKISCLKRKSHVLSVCHPPSKRKSHVFLVLGPPMRKSPVSCLMRKSHFSRENLMSYDFSINPTRKSHGT